LLLLSARLKPCPFKTELVQRSLRRGYSISTSALYRNQNAKWLFPQEKATFQALVTSTDEVKML
jgi:hypothetical protein